MGIFDKFKQDGDEEGGGATALKDKAEQMAGSSAFGDTADKGLDKAGQMLDEKTGNKFSGQIDNGVDKAKDALGQKSGRPDAPAEGDGQAAQPQPQPADQPPQG